MQTGARLLLVAEDDPEDRLLIQDALEACGHPSVLRFVEDGEELLLYLHRRGRYRSARQAPVPSLVLLDLRMPRKDGLEALTEVRSDPRFRRLPVVVLTTSSAEEDIASSYERGANSYVVKPTSFEGWTEAMRLLTTYWFDLATVSPPLPADAEPAEERRP